MPPTQIGYFYINLHDYYKTHSTAGKLIMSANITSLNNRLKLKFS